MTLIYRLLESLDQDLDYIFRTKDPDLAQELHDEVMRRKSDRAIIVADPQDDPELESMRIRIGQDIIQIIVRIKLKEAISTLPPRKTVQEATRDLDILSGLERYRVSRGN